MIREYKFKFDWLVFFLIFLPTFYIAGHELRSVQENFFQISAIALLGVMCVNKWLGAFLIWAVFQFVFFDKLGLKSETIQNLFFGVFIYQMIVLYANRDHYKRYFKVIIGVLLLSVLWIPLQMFNLDPVFRMADYDIQKIMTDFTGWFGLSAILGNYAAVSLPLSFALNPFLIIIGVIGLWFSKSTFSVAAGIIACLFFCWFYKRLYFYVVTFVMIVALSFYAYYDCQTGQFDRRLNVWNVALDRAFDNQFFGHGIGAYGTNYLVLEGMPNHDYKLVKSKKEFYDFMLLTAEKSNNQDLIEYVKTLPENFNAIEVENEFKKYNALIKVGDEFRKYSADIMAWRELHNEYLQVFFDMGFVGLFIMLGFIIDMFKRFYRFGRQNLESIVLMSSFVAILIISFGHFPFHLARLAGPFIAIIALLDKSLLQLRKFYNSDLVI